MTNDEWINGYKILKKILSLFGSCAIFIVSTIIFIPIFANLLYFFGININNFINHYVALTNTVYFLILAMFCYFKVKKINNKDIDLSAFEFTNKSKLGIVLAYFGVSILVFFFLYVLYYILTHSDGGGGGIFPFMFIFMILPIVGIFIGTGLSFVDKEIFNAKINSKTEKKSV